MSPVLKCAHMALVSLRTNALMGCSQFNKNMSKRQYVLNYKCDYHLLSFIWKECKKERFSVTSVDHKECGQATCIDKSNTHTHVRAHSGFITSEGNGSSFEWKYLDII